ncbi:MAG: citrate synthase [Candidatus Thermoplasmatota archaeon]|uniref:Citrate synthase n=1 Tax=Candidatus Sysuiplasma superficiale TaxID=2823368 RepID=A0A8J7YM55_9ARCH|nr:citrate synthase [Candidatus Sysuiplasma superficiale]MCL4347268.1 citrate synthase [Candidatus Thermoplasmatota archaeon]
MNISNGLEDVYIKNTSITFIDGEKGILRYRGYDIHELAENCTFEEVAYLMIFGELPSRNELVSFSGTVQKSFSLPSYVLNVIDALPQDADILSVFETAFAAFSSEERNFSWSREATLAKAPEILGHAAAVLAAAYRHSQGLKYNPPPASDSYAKSFLSASFGAVPERKIVDAMNRSLVLYADHEVPASTTAALVASSTLSDMYSSIAAAVAALRGPLHGGAAEAAYRQFTEIGRAENTDEWFSKNIIQGKKRLMGFGHRVYRTYDPRMAIFKSMAASLAKDEEERNLLRIAERLERLGVEKFSPKGIYPNTDFYSGIAFRCIGFPVTMFTSLFALSRTAGWIAHMSEYVENGGRIMRPRAVYIGHGPRELPGEKAR